MSCFVIAEAGVNHNGSSELALQLVEVAARCGADAVKFQTFSAERLVRPGASTAQYQASATGESDQFAMLKRLELSEEAHRRIAARCTELGIEFMSTPFDEDAARFLLALGMRRIKVPSGEITNIPFLEFLADADRPMIVSTGMATLAEIDAAVAAIARRRALRGFTAPLAECVTILHCTSNYPAADADVNLRAMATIAAATGLPVGYSDHTRGIAVTTAAVALGATVIEKHFTVDKSLPGPDHAPDVVHRRRGDLVRQTYALELLVGLDRPRAGEQRRRIGHVHPECVEPVVGERRRLAHHPVGGLRAEAELESDRAVAASRCGGQLGRARERRSRIVLHVAAQEADVLRPGGALRVLGGGVEADQRRLALAREDDRLVALHAPEVAQVEDVVRRPHDQRVELLLDHQRANALELRLVPRPAHEEIVTPSSHPRHRHVRVSPLASPPRAAGIRPHPMKGGGAGSRARVTS